MLLHRSCSEADTVRSYNGASVGCRRNLAVGVMVRYLWKSGIERPRSQYSSIHTPVVVHSRPRESAPSERAPPDNGAIPRIALTNVGGIREALRQTGTCIVKHVVRPSELEHAEGLLWAWLESLSLGISRSDPRSMRGKAWKQLGYANTGVVAEYSIGQSEFLWYLRLLPRVRRTFAAAWNLILDPKEIGDPPLTDNDMSSLHNIPSLLTSFDGCGLQRNIFLPGISEPTWRTEGRWFHLDQNARRIPGLHTYQGLVNFFPSDGNSGSTVVVPKSHHQFIETLGRWGKLRRGKVI